MATTLLDGSALSAFFGSMAVTTSAGIQMDEAVRMLVENRDDSRFKRVCDQLYTSLAGGSTMAEAMDATRAFPPFTIDMVKAGETSGRLEQVFKSLDLYYDQEDRIFAKIRTSVGYPAALLCIMVVILAFTDAFILPVFANAYASMAGSLTAGSNGMVGVAMNIGWVALVVAAVFAVVAVVVAVAARTEGGRQWVVRLGAAMPSTRQAVYQMAVARFTSVLCTYVSSGVADERAMSAATATVTNPVLKGRLQDAYDAMIDAENPRSLEQAISENNVFDAFYARVLAVGAQAGSTEELLERFSDIYLEDASDQIDRVVDRIDPIFAAVLTVVVGITLVAVMLPLIGMMSAIG
jgi:type IV pilus assembly protein PilC